MLMGKLWGNVPRTEHRSQGKTAGLNLKQTSHMSDRSNDFSHRRMWAGSVLFQSMFLLALLMLLASAANAVQRGQENLPVYTSPIDITGFRVELHVVAPDRETGKPTDIALPTGMLGPKMSAFFNTPLSTQIDTFWSSTPDPNNNNKTQRELACTGPKGIIFQVEKAVSQIGSGFHAYDISCNLATKGQLLVKQVGSVMFLGYLLTGNKVSFAATTPGTCHAGNGAPVCPNDPRFTVTFASEIVTEVRTPDLCHLMAEGAEVVTQGVNIEGSNLAGSLGQLTDSLFLGHKFTGAERAIQATQTAVPLPLDTTFKELRDSAACTGKDPVLRRTLAAFRDFETEIQSRQIVFRLSHAGIAAPTLQAPDAAAKAQAPSQPSFTRPMISTSQPIARAGTAVQVSGQYFPANMDFSTTLPVTFGHGGYGGNSIILGGGGPCFAPGATELQWGPANGPARVERLAGDAVGGCISRYGARNLVPGTVYQFRARDCDAVTCSPWSQLLRVTTAAVDPNRGRVILTIDGEAAAAGGGAVGGRASVRSIGRASTVQSTTVSQSASGRATNMGSVSATRGPALGVLMAGQGTQLGSAMTTTLGTFDATVTIPANLSPGPHTIRATSDSATAEVAITVSGASAGGGRASIMMVGLLRGETGCPNHPISSTQTDASFMLFGSGFAAGPVTLHLDAPNAPAVGTATARPDGSFCQQMAGIPGRLAGAHNLVAVQNGAMQAQTQITFVPPSVVR
jgi:hypothetical protein